jgi:L-alanine-DL-glutamate epimerase-like enolase superfamily enzyme
VATEPVRRAAGPGRSVPAEAVASDLLVERLGVVESVEASAYTIPTDAPEADGTLSWDSTTLVLVQVACDGLVGTGWTYGAPACVDVVDRVLAPHVVRRAPLDIGRTWSAMVRELRNIGRPGIGGMALSAVDCALWDLKARLLGLPLHRLLGAVHDSGCPCTGCSARSTTRCPSTARAGSRRTTRASSVSSWLPGSRTASPG